MALSHSPCPHHCRGPTHRGTPQEVEQVPVRLLRKAQRAIEYSADEEHAHDRVVQEVGEQGPRFHVHGEGRLNADQQQNAIGLGDQREREVEQAQALMKQRPRYRDIARVASDLRQSPCLPRACTRARRSISGTSPGASVCPNTQATKKLTSTGVA